jgi:cyclopropane-fatty-acyl-phospholipid synthase
MMLPSPVKSTEPLRLSSRLYRKFIFGIVRRLRSGQLAIQDANGRQLFGIPEYDSAGQELPPVEIQVHRPQFYGRVLWGGGLGAAESLMDGDWTCSDLTGLVRLMTRNLDLADDFDRGFGRWRKLWERTGHWLRRNSPRQARQNIREHYDLGNDFFELFLDPTMNYSSAIFSDLAGSGHGESLHRGQLNKMDRLCRMLDLGPQDHLLEIGTGWGSLACYAAKHFGCRVTTTTISREQYAWACRRVETEGLGERVTVLDRDYRLLEGKYDKIISVEMIEAVGDHYYETFFQKCNSLLKPDGLLLLQAITIVDQRYQQHLRSVDFICKYIFPGGSLPSISRLVQCAADAASMRLVQLNDYAPHYAETLRRWRQRFHQQLEQVRALGYDERFIRMWDYYLAYCEAGFDERQINLVHLLLAHRQCRLDHGTNFERLAPQTTHRSEFVAESGSADATLNS